MAGKNGGGGKPGRAGGGKPAQKGPQPKPPFPGARPPFKPQPKGGKKGR